MSSSQKKVNKSSLGRVARGSVLEPRGARKLPVSHLEDPAVDLREGATMKTAPSVQTTVENLTATQRQIIESVRRLSELRESLNRDHLVESLSTGRMRDFLTEADKSETQYISKLDQAIDGLAEELKALGELGKSFDSAEIKRVVDDLKSKLLKVALEPDKFDSFAAFTGFSMKQTVFIANGVADARAAVKSALSTAAKVIETLEIDKDGEEELHTYLEGGVNATETSGKITLIDFHNGIAKKLGTSAKGGNWFTSALKGISSFLDGAGGVKIDGAAFAQEISDLTPRQIIELTKKPVVASAGASRGSAVDDSVKAAAAAAGADSPAAVVASAESPQSKGAPDAESGGGASGEKSLTAFQDVETGKIKFLEKFLGDDTFAKISAIYDDKYTAFDALKNIPRTLKVLRAAGIKTEGQASQEDLLLERLNVLAGTSNRQTNRRDK